MSDCTAAMPSFWKQRAIIEQDQQTLGGNRNAWFILQCIVDPKVLDMISSLPRWWKVIFFPLPVEQQWQLHVLKTSTNRKKKKKRGSEHTLRWCRAVDPFLLVIQKCGRAPVTCLRWSGSRHELSQVFFCGGLSYWNFTTIVPHRPCQVILLCDL